MHLNWAAITVILSPQGTNKLKEGKDRKRRKWPGNLVLSCKGSTGTVCPVLGLGTFLPPRACRGSS